MKTRIAVTLLLAFAATSVFAARPRPGSGGGRSSGGHFSRGVSGGSSRATRAGGEYAVPRHSGGGRPDGRGPSGAQLRHPRAGTGSAYYGYGRHGHYGHGYGYYGRPYYSSYYPYYGYGYGYYPYASPYYGLGFGLNVALGGGYPDTYYGADPEEEAYGGEGGGVPDERYADRGRPREEDRGDAGELRLIVRPDDASVYVDDEFRGIASRIPTLRVAPGRHRVEVVRPGYRVAERRVEVGPEGGVTLQIELEPR